MNFLFYYVRCELTLLHRYIWLPTLKFGILDREYKTIICEKRLDQNVIRQEMSFWNLKGEKPSIYFIRTTIGRIVFLFSLIPIFINQKILVIRMYVQK